MKLITFNLTFTLMQIQAVHCITHSVRASRCCTSRFLNRLEWCSWNLKD